MAIYGVETGDVFAPKLAYTDLYAAFQQGQKAVQEQEDRQRQEQAAEIELMQRNAHLDQLKQRAAFENMLWPEKVTEQGLQNTALGYKNDDAKREADERAASSDGMTNLERLRYAPRIGQSSLHGPDGAANYLRQQQLELARQRESRLSAAANAGPKPVYDDMKKVDDAFKAALGYTTSELGQEPPERQHLDDSGYWIGEYKDGKPVKERSIPTNTYNDLVGRRDAVIAGRPRALNPAPAVNPPGYGSPAIGQRLLGPGDFPIPSSTGQTQTPAPVKGSRLVMPGLSVHDPLSIDSALAARGRGLPASLEKLRQRVAAPAGGDDSASILEEARAAIEAGADAQAVKDRLEARGIDSGGL